MERQTILPFKKMKNGKWKIEAATSITKKTVSKQKYQMQKRNILARVVFLSYIYLFEFCLGLPL